MLSGKAAAVLAIVILAVFSGITVEAINHGSTSITSTSVTSTQNSVKMNSPENGAKILIAGSNDSLSITVNVTSNDRTIYIYDISPANLSGLEKSGSVELYSLPNLTHFNTTLYPYNYEIVNISANSNNTIHLTLYINSTVFSQMKTSILPEGKIYPYVVEILAETSSGAAFVGFTLIKIPPA